LEGICDFFEGIYFWELICWQVKQSADYESKWEYPRSKILRSNYGISNSPWKDKMVCIVKRAEQRGFKKLHFELQRGWCFNAMP